MALITTDYLKPISFLIVEERSYMRRIIKGALETLGAKSIDEASDGRQAWNSIKSWAPDILLSERWLAGMNGLELLRMIRHDKSALKFLPVIMVTGETRREQVVGARNAGVSEYVAKPITAKGLFLRIRETIERPRPFVETKVYFGPDRRRRTEIMDHGKDRRGLGGDRPQDPTDNRGLTQDQIDRLVAGDKISDAGLS
ncbi:MAG: response regulator [Alphaproteobacteria bacterium]|nr:response regulator [Alphaproteobacteria bacterium]